MSALLRIACFTLLFAFAGCGGTPAKQLAAAAPQRWTPVALSTDQYESSPSLSRDGRELFFFRADRNFDNYRLLHSHCRDGRWTPPREPPFAAPPGVLETDPAFGAGGRYLYYGSARHTGRDLDIWRVARRANGAWGVPQRLPEPVNSPQTELLPREQADGRLLFGSDRPGGAGGRDLYFASPLPGGDWRVEALPAPVNGPGDEYEADLSNDGKVLVVVANRGERSRLYVYDLLQGKWRERGQVSAREEVFQIGPLLSPDGKRLLFAQDHGRDSGEFYLVDLAPDAESSWPSACGD